MTEHTNIIHSLYQIGALKFGHFTLKSGQTSSVYINLRIIISYPDILKEIANLMWEKIKDCDFELLCGVPYAALPIAACISLQHNIPMIMVRKEKKDYGTKQMVEGVYQPGDRCIVIEDIITSGSSIIEVSDELKKSGLIINDVIAFAGRTPEGISNLRQHFKPHVCFTLQEMLSVLMNSNLLSNDERNIIEVLQGKAA